MLRLLGYAEETESHYITRKPIGRTIELLGFPGAGKTTLCQELTKRFQRVQWHALHLTPTLEDIEALNRMNTHLWKVRTNLQSRRWKNRRVFRLFQKLVIQQAFLERCAKGLVIIDEGLAKTAWSIMFREPDFESEPWQRMLSYSSAAVLVLDIPPAIARERIFTKSRGGDLAKITENQRNLYLGSDDSSHWQRAFACHERIVDHLEGCRSAVYRIDASVDIGAMVDRAIEVLEPWFQ